MADITHEATSGGPPMIRAIRRLGVQLMRAVRAIFLWRSRMRQRTELVELPPHLLFDIGLTRADVEAEVRKRPWERPSLCTRPRFHDED